MKCGKLKASQEMDEWTVVGDKSLHHCLPRSHVGSEFDHRPAHEEVEVCPVERLSSENRNTGCNDRDKPGLPQGPRPSAYKSLIIESNIWSMAMTFGVGFATPISP